MPGCSKNSYAIDKNYIVFQGLCNKEPREVDTKTGGQRSVRTKAGGQRLASAKARGHRLESQR